MPAACRSSSRRRSKASSSSIAACRQPRARNGGRSRARPPRIRPSRSTTSRRPISPRRVFRRVLGGSPMVGGPSHVSVSREERVRFDHVARRARRLCRPATASCTSARWRLRPTARDSKARICSSPPMAARRSAARRTATRCAFICILRSRRRGSPTASGVLLMMPNQEVWTFQRRRGSRAARRQRLSCRQRRSAPRGADGHQRPGAFGAARDLELSAGQLPRRSGERRHRRAACARRSRGCHCDAAGCRCDTCGGTRLAGSGLRARSKRR